MAKHSIFQTQSMSQKLSPQQIQLMKLLQIPTATLNQRVEEELEVNPALEEGNEESSHEEIDQKDEPVMEFDEYLKDYIDDDVASYKLSAGKYMSEDDDQTIPIELHETYHEHLEIQLGMSDIDDPREELIVLQIIGSIDEDGYLRRDAYSMVNDLAFSQGIVCTEEDIERLVKIVQTFEPAGTGARDLQECLLLQIDRKLAQRDSFDKAFVDLLLKGKLVITKYFDEFSKKHYDKLQKQLKVEDEELKNIIDTIIKLNPKPASSFSTPREKILHIIPDFILNNKDGELELSLNSKNAPDLKVSDQYKEMLRDYTKTSDKKTKSEKEAVMFIKQKIDSARWFIDAIKQRQDTMYRTMYSIMQFQMEYFQTGDEKTLKPMILKDIADVTGLDISTVSRVANSKYVMTEYGTKRLKDFFSESLQTSSGEEVSTTEVKKILSEMISAESKKNLLSDEKLKDILQEKGYEIARRTVAKYREQLDIPVARLRKEL